MVLLKTVFKREKKEQHRLFKICFLCGRPSADLILPGGRERFLIKNGESEWNVRRNCGREITVVIGQVIVGGEMFGRDIFSHLFYSFTPSGLSQTSDYRSHRSFCQKRARSQSTCQYHMKFTRSTLSNRILCRYRSRAPIWSIQKC